MIHLLFKVHQRWRQASLCNKKAQTEIFVCSLSRKLCSGHHCCEQPGAHRQLFITVVETRPEIQPRMCLGLRSVWLRGRGDSESPLHFSSRLQGASFHLWMKFESLALQELFCPHQEGHTEVMEMLELKE